VDGIALGELDGVEEELLGEVDGEALGKADGVEVEGDSVGGGIGLGQL